MGVGNDLKKLFFGATSIAKTVKEKTTEYLEENADDILEKGKSMAKDLGDKLSTSSDKIKDKFEEQFETTPMDDLMDVGKEKVKGAFDGIKNNETVQELTEKAKEVGGDLYEKFGETSEKVGSKVLDAKEKLMEKANEAKDILDKKIDEGVAQAEAWEAERKAKTQAGFMKEDFDASGSLLDDTDSFFEKADKYADGDYSAATEGKVDLIEGAEVPKRDPAKAAGFTDLDNDGNELVDDAIIED